MSDRKIHLEDNEIVKLLARFKDDSETLNFSFSNISTSETKRKCEEIQSRLMF